LCFVASPAIALRVGLDPTQLAWRTGEWGSLALVYLSLAVPFGISAVATVIAIALDPDCRGRVYGASFIGAGIGCALAIAVLFFASPGRALMLPAVLALTGAVAARTASESRDALVIAAVVVAVAIVKPLWTVEPFPYKPIRQVENLPEARRIATRHHPVGSVVAIVAPSFRQAPGLSLAYRGPIPSQVALLVDGDMAGAVPRPREPGELEMLEWLPGALPHVVRQAGRVLVVGGNQAADLWIAGARDEVEAWSLELHPEIARIADSIALESGASKAPIRWVVDDARSFLSRTDQRFDLIVIGPGTGGGLGSTGLHATTEDFEHTIDAYEAYLGHLAPGGMLAVTSWSDAPERTAVRRLFTLALAGASAGVDSLPTRFVVARSWATSTLLFSPWGFRDSELDAARAWATVRQFDLDWLAGEETSPAQFHLTDQLTLRDAARATASRDGIDRFLEDYAFSVEPVSDARPFPHHFVRARSLPAMMQYERGTWLPFAEWGYLATLATLAQGVLLAGLLMLVPMAIRRPERGWSRTVGYFGAIGLAYLTAEIAAIQQLSLLLGHPVYAVAAVVATLLVFSGLGSWLSDRLVSPAPRRFAAILGVVLVGYAAILLPVVHLVLGSPLVARVAVAGLVIGPLGFIMGVPFPVGLRALVRDDARRLGWAWATNGFASVVAAPLATLVAIEMGSAAVFLLAAAAYGVAALYAPRGIGS
jgi:F0F1-type ATP synthase membrane subunit c/vacuolar-type H+-ATPase subunit K/spermidine synthase